MRISKSMFSKICITAGFIVCTQFSFATDVLIRKDDQSPPPQPMPNRGIEETEIPVTATIDNSTLAIYFAYGVGEATLRVYDENRNVVYQGVTDTGTTLSVAIASNQWEARNYTLTISYGDTNLIGDFETEE